MLVHGRDIVVDRQSDHLRTTPQHEMLIGKTVVQRGNGVRFIHSRAAHQDVAKRHHSTRSRTARPCASSSRVAINGGNRRTVCSPALHTRSPPFIASPTTCAAVSMTSSPHMY